MITRSLISRFPSLSRLTLGRVRKRVPIVRQVTATDCGAAALAMILGYHGKHVPLDEVRRMVGSGRNGANAENILRVGRTYGLRGRGIRAEIEDLASLPTASILF